MTTSCDDYLDVSSSSVVSTDFVFSNGESARSAMNSVYEQWRIDSYVHSNGLFYNLCVGSDSERHPESYSAQSRHIPENLYYGGTSSYNIDDGGGDSAWEGLYTIIATCNTLCASFEGTDEFSTYMSSGEPSDLSQIYGEAVAMRATCYLELTRFWGDVPHQLVSGETASDLTPRDQIWEYHINKLIEVEPYMYRVGEDADATAIVMTRTYVQGLIGRLCLYAGGYSTRRTDLGSDFYKDLDGNTLSFENADGISEDNTTSSIYARRTDWKDFYEIAETYLTSCVNDPGSVQLYTSDPRSNSGTRVYDNPYQYSFQLMNDLTISGEDVYEIAESQGVQTERPYAFGRPSDGGGTNAYPCKNYGQFRYHPTFYYGDFHPLDLRRDVCCTVTASSGGGIEKIISFEPGSKSNGGIALNKWDENRMASPWTAAQRKSGINDPYMRFSDVILMLAEVEDALGNESTAKSYLTQIHNRAFGDNASEYSVDDFISDCGGDLTDAIAQERKLEMAGEGIRRYDLIRTGKLPQAIKELREGLSDMIDGLESDGYYEFDNGNVISNYIWTKTVDLEETDGYRLTASADDSNPALYPGWRGQNDSWSSVAATNGTSTSNLSSSTLTNLAIEGLFEYIDPDGDRAAELEADGYTKTDWGITITENASDYCDYVFRGYTDYTVPPIYFIPYNSNMISTSNGVLTNGYGFQDE